MKALFVLLENDNSKVLMDMNVIGLASKNVFSSELTKGAVLTTAFTEDDKQHYINKFLNK